MRIRISPTPRYLTLLRRAWWKIALERLETSSNGVAGILNADALMPFYWRRLGPVASELRRRMGVPVWIDIEYVVYRYATAKSKLTRSTRWPAEFREHLGIEDFPEKVARICSDALRVSHFVADGSRTVGITRDDRGASVTD